VRRLWALIPLIAALLACRSHFGFGLLADAKFLIAENSKIVGLSQIVPNATHDYFWSSSGNSIPYYRPFTKVSWVVEATLGHRRPIVFHAVQLAWFLLAIAALLWLAREIGLRRRFAALSGVIFALHPATAEPVALIMARSDVVAAAGSIAALAAFRAFVRTSRRRFLVMHALAFLVALASKESAVIVPLLITLWILLDRRKRWLALAPAWAIALAYLIVRSRVVSGTGVTFDPLRIAVGGGLSIAATAKIALETGVRNISRAEAMTASAVATSIAAWLAVGCVAVCARRRRVLLGLVAWIVAAIAMILLPRAVYVPGAEGKIVLADRWLLPAVAAASLIAGVAAQAFLRGLRAVAVFGLVAVWALVMITFAPTLRGYYASDQTLLELEERNDDRVPEEFRTFQDRCRAGDRTTARLLARGDARSALAASDARAPECPSDFVFLFNRLSALTTVGRFEDARVVADTLLRRTDGDLRTRPRAFYLGGLAALETGDAKLAEDRFRAATHLGFESCELLAQSARAAMILEHPLEGAQRFEDAFVCTKKSGKPQAILLRLASRAWTTAGRTSDAERALAEAAKY